MEDLESGNARKDPLSGMVVLTTYGMAWWGMAICDEVTMNPTLPSMFLPLKMHRHRGWMPKGKRPLYMRGMARHRVMRKI